LTNITAMSWTASTFSEVGKNGMGNHLEHKPGSFLQGILTLIFQVQWWELILPFTVKWLAEVLNNPTGCRCCSMARPFLNIQHRHWWAPCLSLLPT